jgi:CheY-like chemotaxis protein
VQIVPNPTNKAIRVLLLEDSRVDADLIARELGRSEINVLLERVDSEASFIAALDTFAPDVVLSDHALAQFNSHAALEALRAISPATPFIIVTGSQLGSITSASIRAEQSSGRSAQAGCGGLPNARHRESARAESQNGRKPSLCADETAPRR